MFEKVAFKRGHLSEMLNQKSNSDNVEFFKTVDFDVLEKLSSITGMINGKPVVCGGIVPYWNGRGYLWTVFDENSKEYFVPIFRGIKSFLNDVAPFYNRLEIAVPCNFEIGIRRAKMLGFITECERAIKFLPNGEDCSLMVYLGGR